jgi:hypothetical protein
MASLQVPLFCSGAHLFFIFLIDGRKKDAQTPEKPFKRRLKLSLLNF